MEGQHEHVDDSEPHPGMLGITADTDVKVVVRVRPHVLTAELQPDAQTCVEVEGHNSLIVKSGNEATSMQFNWVAGPATTQNDFFKVVGKPTVESCLSGFNSSIFAYGQTGSGKTYTMIGDLPEDSDALPVNAGLIPRIFQYLWRRMPEVQASMLSHCAATMAAAAAEQGNGASSSEPSLTWLVRCSMLEIHREDIIDLLRPGNGPLTLREDIRKGVYVEGLCETVVENVQDALAVLRTGIASRQVAATDFNAASSRSHCIFTCHVESRLEPQSGLVNVRSSRLHLVDLAGSERLRYGSGAMSNGEGSGKLLRETTSINSSLTVLGMVILKLTEQQPHIPFRNSKLTFLLQDSIGGNAKTVIVANVSPSEVCLQETLSTLGFAARARKLVNKAVINEDTSGDAAVLRSENKRLRQELALARQLIQHSASQPDGQTAAELEEQQAQLQQALVMLAELGDRNSELEDALNYSKRERSELERGCLEVKQELAAVQVTLQQTIRENRTWRHKWFKLDRPGRSVAGSRAPSETGLEEQPYDISLPLVQPSSASTAPAVSQHAAGSNTPAAAVLADGAVSDGMSCTEQEHRTDQILKMLNSRLSELVSTVCPSAAATPENPAAAAATTAALGQKVRQSLVDLAAICRPKAQEVPELSSVIDSLELLAAWQHYQSTVAEPHGNHTAAAAATTADSADPASAGSAVPCATVSGIPKTSFTPFELHRQLREERALTAKLSEQVRQLQQKLVLAAETAGSAAGKSMLSMSSDSVLRGSCITALQNAADAADCADSAAVARSQRDQRDHQPVLLQLHISGTAEEHSKELAVAHARIADLQKQVAALRDQLDEVTRKGADLQGRLASARTVLAAARCSTPSSLNSSRIPSPQECFSPLRSVIAESIDEGNEEDYEGVPPPGSWRRGHKAPGSPSTPVKHRSTPHSSHNSRDLAAEGSGVLAEEDSETALSPQTHWDREHSKYQQHEQHLEQRRQLVHAVHAAIREAGSRSPTPKQPSPASVIRTSDKRSPSLRLSVGYHSSPAKGRQSSRLSASMEAMQQQLQQAVDDTKQMLSHPSGQNFRASLGSPLQQRQGQWQSGGNTADFTCITGRSGPARPAELYCDSAGLLMAGCNLTLTGTVAEEDTLNAASLFRAWAQQQQQQQVRQGSAQAAADAGPASPAGSVHSSTGHATADVSVLAGETSAAASAAAETSAIAVAGGDSGGDEAVSSFQRQQQPTPGPDWGMDDYEEEFRQLQEQLQELISANSALKATLQQRERALADKDAQLEQQGHDLECCEQVMQELQERLAANEAATAAAAAEHADAIWAKGQVAGLLELNEQLQFQLEMRGEELQELKAALERFMATGAAPQTAEAYAAAAEVFQDDSTADGPPSSSKGFDQLADPSTVTDAAKTAVAPPSADTARDQVEASTVGPDTAGGAELSAASPADGLLAPSVDLELQLQQPATTADAGAAAQGEHEQAVSSVAAVDGETAVMSAVAAFGSPAIITALAEQVTPVASRAAQLPAGTPGSTSSQQLTAGKDPGNGSVQDKLRLQTSQLSAQPANLDIAAKQAILLRHQLEAVGLQLQQKQLEAKLAHVKLQMDRLQQHQQAQLHHQQMQLQRYQRHRQQLQQGCITPRSQHKLQRSTVLASSHEAGSTVRNEQSAVVSPVFNATTRRSASRQIDAGASNSSRVLGSNQHQQDSGTAPVFSRPARHSTEQEEGGTSSSASRAATPSSSGSISGTDMRSSSSCSDVSDASSSGQCVDILSELVTQLNALAQESHDTSTFRAASASTLSPLPGKEANWPAVAAAQLQTRLQVSSAYELEAARGLMNATEVAMELQTVLCTAEKASRAQKQRQRQQQQQQKLDNGESPVVRSLLEKFDTVQPAAAAPAEQQQQLPQAADSATGPQQQLQTAAVGSIQTLNSDVQRQPSQELPRLLEQLEEQQRAILQAVGSQANPAVEGLSRLVAVQQQLLDQIRHAAAAAADPAVATPAMQQEASWQSVDSAQGLPHSSGSGQPLPQQQQQPEAASPHQPAVQPKQHLPAADSPAVSSASPTRRQLRSKQRDSLRRSLEGFSEAVAAAAAPRDVSDQQQLRDSFKGERLQQLIRSSKAGAMHSSVGAAEGCDASCQTDAQATEAAAAAGAEASAAGQRAASPVVRLQVIVPNAADASQQADASSSSNAASEVVQLRGELVKLQLQVQELKTRARVAEDMRHRLLQALPRSHSSCSSRGDIDFRSSVDGSEFGSGLTADVASSTGSAAAANRAPLMPAGLFSPRNTSASISAGGSSPGATSSKMSQQQSSLLLTSKLRELQAQCVSKDRTIQQLENQVRQLDMQIKQAAAAAAASGGSAAARACSTPRTTAGLLSPRHVAGPFSPKVGMLTPSRAGVIFDTGAFEGVFGYGTPTKPLADGSSGPSPTKVSRLGNKAPAGGVVGLGWFSPGKALAAVPEGQQQQQQDDHLACRNTLYADQGKGWTGLSAEEDVSKGVKASSSRRLSLGSNAKALRFAGGGRLRVAAMNKAAINRRQSMG